MNKLVYKLLDNYIQEEKSEIWKNIAKEVQKNSNMEISNLLDEYYSCICIHNSLKKYHPEEKEKELLQELKEKTKLSLLKLDDF